MLNNSADWRPWTKDAGLAGDALLPLHQNAFRGSDGNNCAKKTGRDLSLRVLGFLIVIVRKGSLNYAVHIAGHGRRCLLSVACRVLTHCVVCPGSNLING